MNSSLGFAIALCFAFPPLVCADVAYVDDDAPPNGDGQSWTTAYRYLQDAVSEAAAPGSSIDEIRIAQGAYRPDLSEYGHATPSDVLATFQLVDDLSLLGGYAGIGAPDPDARDIDAYETILTGDVLGDDTDDLGNMQDNIAAIVNASETESPPVLDGLTIVGGNGHNGNGLNIGGGVLADPGFVSVRACTIHHNRAEYGGGVYVRYGGATIEDCTFYKNRCTHQGAAVRVRFSAEVSISNCDFFDNATIEGKGGAISVDDAENITLINGYFKGNSASVAGGFSLVASQHIELADCTALDNVGTVAVGGGQVITATALVDRCTFHANEAGFAVGGLAISGSGAGSSVVVANTTASFNSAGTTIGGMVLAGGNPRVHNCRIHHNSAVVSGGVNAANATFTNCTIAFNSGDGFVSSAGGSGIVENSILWGNTPEQIGTETIPRGGTVDIAYTCIEDGWPGFGNITDDPLFVQSGTGNLRLAHDSPCLDAGFNDLIAQDLTDLDSDGDTDEPVPYDLDNNPRVQSGTVDMGAYEGSFDPLPPAASEPNFDPGEAYVLSINAPGLALGESIVLIAWNNSDMENATVTVTDLRDTLGRGDGEPLLQIDTDVPDGQALFSVSMPITAADFGGASANELDMTVLDDAIDEWVLAPALNSANSPGFDEPIGERFVQQTGDPAIPSFELGDHGVFWNIDTEIGLVWANVDHPGLFGMRVGVCPGDGAPYGGNHFINVHDLLGMLAAWGTVDRWFDATDDGTVDHYDLIELLNAWGVCSP